MNGYLLDTNIVTAHLRKNSLVRRRLRNAEIIGHPVMLNAISYYETRRGLLFAGAHEQLRAFEQLWQSLGIVMIDQVVLDKAAEVYAALRKAGQLIEDADILIAAIAIVHDMTLVTNNTTHFIRLPDLHLEDWLIPPA
jgi:tRNA(fMet)-specific endonuclease VapC